MGQKVMFICGEFNAIIGIPKCVADTDEEFALIILSSTQVSKTRVITGPLVMRKKKVKLTDLGGQSGKLVGGSK